MSLELIVVTPKGEAFTGAVEWVVLPGSEGDFGVLERHERYLATLRFGAMEIRAADGSQWSALTEGFADVDGEQVVVLAGSYQRIDEIDRAEAERERDDARAALNELSGSEADLKRRPALEQALDRAELRVELRRG